MPYKGRRPVWIADCAVSLKKLDNISTKCHRLSYNPAPISAHVLGFMLTAEDSDTYLKVAVNPDPSA